MPNSLNTLYTKFNITDIGAGTITLLFAHGFGCDQSIWSKVAPAFTEQFRVVLFDYVGSGGSDIQQYDHQHYDDLSAYAEDLIALCDGLQLQNVYLVGHSVSGAIAMLATIKRPELFQKLITIAPSPHYINEDDYYGGFDQQDVQALLEMMHLNYFDWASYLAPAVIGSSATSTHSDNLKKSFLRNDPMISETFAKATFYCDIRDQLPHVQCPVCILYCLEDVIVPQEVIDYLVAHLPNCTKQLISATGHYPQITNPDSLITAIHHSISLSNTA